MRLWVPGPQCERNGGVQPDDYCHHVQADDEQADGRLREGSSGSGVAIGHHRPKRAVGANRTPGCAATAGDYIEVRTAAQMRPGDHRPNTIASRLSMRAVSVTSPIAHATTDIPASR